MKARLVEEKSKKSTLLELIKEFSDKDDGEGKVYLEKKVNVKMQMNNEWVG